MPRGSENILDLLPAGSQARWLIYRLHGVRFFSTIVYSVIQSILIFYLITPLHASVVTANQVASTFIAYTFVLHLLAGVWIDKVVSARFILTLGLLFELLAAVVILGLGDTSSGLYYGLSILLAGSGFTTTAINCVVTDMLPEDRVREHTFFWQYTVMNMGFFIGFMFSGYLYEIGAYRALFAIGVVCAMLSMVTWILFYKGSTHMKTSSIVEQRYPTLAKLASAVLLCLLPSMLMPILHNMTFAYAVVLLVVTGLFLVIGYMGYRDRVFRSRFFLFLMLSTIGIVFWTIYLTNNMGQMHFIMHNVDRSLHGFAVPPQWFLNVNTMGIIILGPMMVPLMDKLRALGWNMSISMQFFYALILLGVGFVILPVGIALGTKGLMSPTWIIASLILQTLGELLVNPVGYTMVGMLAPKSLQGMMMGAWLLTSGVGSIFAGYYSNRMILGHEATFDPMITNPGYSYTFFQLGCIAFLAAIVLLLIKKNFMHADRH